jgi:2-polyprenyl-3-methyl-5-hydroxy-6-metoxy-1,4-benzoquinol methylase
MKPDPGLSPWQELVRYEACPLCDSLAIAQDHDGNCSRHPLYKPELSAVLRWMRCTSCGHSFRNGYYTEAAFARLFDDTNLRQRAGYDLEGQRPISARMIDRVLPYQSSGTWLDVGPGNGSLLLTAEEYGFTPIGIDLREDNVDALNRLGVHAFCQDLRDIGIEPACAVISMADVLEHMPFPADALQAAHKLLRDGGVLVLSMPNLDSPLWKLLDARNENPYWNELEHFHNFSKSRLYSLLAAHGFRPVRFDISERYRVCMEVLAIRIRGQTDAPAQAT